MAFNKLINIKKTLIILVLLLVGFSKLVFAEITLHPKDFLKGFPICSFASSLGQICKDNPSLLFSDFKNDSTIEIKDEKLLIETDNWYYSFEIINRKKNEVIVEFVDDGKTGTYLAVSHYKINFDRDSYEWKITAKKIISPEEEKTKNFKTLKRSIVFHKSVLNLRKIVKIVTVESTAYWSLVLILSLLFIGFIKVRFKDFNNNRFSRLSIFLFLLSLFIVIANASQSFTMAYILGGFSAFILDPLVVFVGIIIGAIFYRYILLIPALILIGYISVYIIVSNTVMDSYNTPFLNFIRTIVIFYVGYFTSSIRQIIFNR